MTDPVLPPVFIAGNGAVGRVLAWRLARGGVQVIRLGHEPGGLHVRLSDLETGEALAPLQALDSVSRLPDGSLVLVTVKAFQLEAMLRRLEPKLTGTELLVLCQNGLGIGELARKVLPRARFARAVVWFGAIARGESKVELRGQGRVDLASGDDEAPELRLLAEGLRRGGQEVSEAGVWGELEWRKALLNVTLNACCALVGVPNGAALEDPDLKALAQSLLNEALAVARACGLGWDEDQEARAVWQAIRRTAENENSTLQDLRAGRPTEIPWLNGELVRMAEKCGISASLHEALAQLIQVRERSVQKTIAKA